MPQYKNRIFCIYSVLLYSTLHNSPGKKEKERNLNRFKEKITILHNILSDPCSSFHKRNMPLTTNGTQSNINSEIFPE